MSSSPNTTTMEENDNVVIGDTASATETSPDQAPNDEGKIDPHIALMKMPVTDQNSALNCLIGFVGIAQRRGSFALDEAAKAFHCIQMFHPDAAASMGGAATGPATTGPPATSP